MSTGISVVLRTRNGIETASHTFAALASQDLRPDEWIVMDCRSTDGVRELAASYGARILDVDPASYFPGKVLNRAVEAARGDIVVFVNSDTTPLTPAALRRLVAPLADPSVTGSWGRQVPRPEALAWVRRDYASAFPIQGPPPAWLTLSLPFAAIRREVLRARPFYTEAWASEDTEWGAWARRQGRSLVYVPEAAAMHSHNYTLREIYGRRFVEGEADAFIGDGQTAGYLRRWATSVVRDAAAQLRHREWGELARTPLRRAVFWGAHALGRRHGAVRRRKGTGSAVAGQRTVLSHRRDA